MLGKPLFRALSKSWGVLQTQVLPIVLFHTFLLASAPIGVILMATWEASVLTEAGPYV